jgi:putative endonuclease
MNNPTRSYYVYMLANKGRMIYTGVTGDLHARVWQHKSGSGSRFTQHYSTDLLVWFDETSDVHEALLKEKQTKNWRRRWKVDLIEEVNRDWLDLSDGWYE